MLKKIAAAAALVIASSSAFAAQPQTIYAGADVGKSELKYDGAKSRDTSVGAFVGYNILANLAVEAHVRRLGEFNIYGANVKGEQAGVSVLGSIPLGSNFNVFGRLGVNRIEAKADAGRGVYSDSSTGAVVGLGLGYAFTPNVSARLELQKPEEDTTNLSVGVAFQF